MKKFLIFTSLLVLTFFLSLTPSLVTHASVSSPNATTSMYVNHYLPDLVYLKNYRAIASDDTEVIVPSVALDVPRYYNLGGQQFTNNQSFSIPFNYNGSQQFSNIFWNYATTYNGGKVFNLLLDEDPFEYIEFYYNTLVIKVASVDSGEERTPKSITFIRQDFGNATYSLSYKYWNWESQAYGTKTESGNLDRNTYLSIIPDYIYNLYDDEDESNNNVPTYKSSLVLLKDVKLRITLPADTSGTLKYVTTFNAYNNDDVDELLMQFGDEYIKEEPQEVLDIGTWLLDSLDSFLSFEILPDFSLMDILGLILVVPLLLWLFKMLFGG